MTQSPVPFLWAVAVRYEAILRHANARRFVFITLECQRLMSNSFLASSTLSYSIESKVLSRKDGTKSHVVITALARGISCRSRAVEDFLLLGSVSKQINVLE
jgi:hypothetical protein